ncbi:MAG: hypothetical protein AAFV49_00860 [Pseudomonadota bacterium]
MDSLHPALSVVPASARAACSVGMIATNEAELGETVEALHRAGFTPDCTTYLAVRNFGENHFDGYSGIAAFLERAEGRYLLVCHQDVRAIDTRAELEAKLDEIEPDWALAGNAGSAGLGRSVRRISDPYNRDVLIGPLPHEVVSLDENLLIFNLARPITPSQALSGFHFYGTDLCIRARGMGERAWVIDWHVEHLSGGSLNASWAAGRRALERHYEGTLGNVVIQTPTTLLLFGIFKVFRPIRKTVWRVVRHGGQLLAKLGRVGRPT